MLTQYPNTREGALQRIDEYLMKMGHQYELNSCYGIGEKPNMEDYKELIMLRDAMCQDMKVNRPMLLEMINQIAI